MITLSDGSTTITLDPDLYWSDETAWNPVLQQVTPTITGALDIQAGVLTGGRPITLEPEDDHSAWQITSTTVEQLRNWAAVPGKELTLTLRGIARTVLFRHQDGGFEARPVVHFRDRLPSDFYHCTLRFMET